MGDIPDKGTPLSLLLRILGKGRDLVGELRVIRQILPSLHVVGVFLGDALVLAAQEGAEATNGFVEPATAQPRRIAPVAGSAADVRAQAAMDAAEDVTAEANIVQPGDGREGGM